MTSEQWRTATLGSLIDEGIILVHKDGNHGSNYPRTSEFGSEGVPFLTAKLLDDAGNIDFANAPRLANDKANKFTFGFIETDDVLLSHNATVGRVAVVPQINERVLIGTSLTHYRLDKSRLLPKYLAVYFSGRDFQNQLAAVMSQTTRNQVPITAQRKLSVVIPPMSEQRSIANTLSYYDDKIELNRQINQTLEQIAQAIFKSWFVDFEPVKAKIEAKQNGQDPERAAMIAISGKTDEELDALNNEQRQQLTDIAELFPDELVDSEWGEIPNGWEYKSAYHVADVAIGKTPPRKEPEWFSESSNDIRWISIKDMGDSGLYAIKTSEYLTEEAVNKFNVKRIPDNTVILSFKLTVGRVAITEGEMLSNEAIAHFNLGRNAEVTTEYLYQYLKSFNFSNLGSTSSIATAVNSKTIKNMPILLPNKQAVQVFTQSIEPLFMRIKNILHENNTLADIRDSLLPKLLSGELEVA